MVRPSAAQRAHHAALCDRLRKEDQMRTRDLHWPKARDIGLGSIWLIVALYFVLTLVYVPA